MSTRFAILGSGSMGHVYAHSIVRHGGPEMELVAVALGSRAAGLASEFGVDHLEEAEAVFARDDVDAVVIATPHSTHLDLAVAAAEAGKHLVLEKPMALNVGECDRILEAQRAAGVKLTVNSLTRYRGAPRTTKELLDRGEIGDLRMVRVLCANVGYDVADDSWLRNPGEGNAFLDWGTHGCDILRWFSGSEAVTAYAEYANYGDIAAIDPSAMITYRMASGAMVQVWMSWEMPPPGFGSTSQWVLVGSEGIIDMDAYGAVRLGRDGEWRVVFEQAPIDYHGDPFAIERLGAFVDQLKDFVDAVATGREPEITGEDGRASVEMVEAADRSAAGGGAVALPLVPATS
jgi:predicted dehydrogenase